MLAADPVVAALLGLFAETAEYTAAFAADGERPEEAIERVRPLFVVLLDGSMDAASSDLFYAHAARQRLPLAVFVAPERSAYPDAAVRRGVPCAPVPMSLEELEMLLVEASQSRWWERTDRRRAPTMEHGVDGSLVLVDAHGARWQVYDRRGSDRRREHSSGSGERLFVSESGETRVYALAADDTRRTPDVLARQLASARPDGSEG